MADERGWIKLHRELADNWLWQEKPFSKGQAWVDLLMLANHEDKKMPYKGEVIVCKRGDVNLSIAYLSERWGWSRKKTRSFITVLEKDQMLTAEVTTNRTTLTIDNYDKFQGQGTTKGTTKEQRGYQRKNSEGITTKNDKNDKNEKNIGGGGSATLDEWRPPAPGTPEYDAWRNQ